MKTLLESIFSNKEDIIAITHNLLWKGYDEAFLNKDNYISAGKGWQVDWFANKGSILHNNYPQFKNPTLSCMYMYGDPNIHFVLSGNPDSSKSIHFKIKCINITVTSHANLNKIKDRIYDIAQYFYKHPEMFNDYDEEYTYLTWQDFEKKYSK